MKKTSMYYKMDKEAAVSPIVATLVLIVVAVVGAVAVGTIIGTSQPRYRSRPVQEMHSRHRRQLSLSQVQLPCCRSLLELGQWYSTNHTGIQVNVQGGGSGAGLAATAQNVADIGMMSEPMTANSKAAYPTVQPFQVAASGVVSITSTANPAAVPSADITVANLYSMYHNVAIPAAWHTDDAALKEVTDKNGCIGNS